MLQVETDPHGKPLNSPGAKADAGKVRPALVLGGFARALLAVSEIGTAGAVKYTENGWTQVPGGVARYDDAKMRHWLSEHAGQPHDALTGSLHAAHVAWNALARLDLIIREEEKVQREAELTVKISEAMRRKEAGQQASGGSVGKATLPVGVSFEDLSANLSGVQRALCSGQELDTTREMSAPVISDLQTEVIVTSSGQSVRDTIVNSDVWRNTFGKGRPQ